MQTMIGWILLLLGGGLYAAQVISSVSFPLAQYLGIQEKAEASDTLLQRSERYTAYWDLIALLWLPLAGLLMVIGHQWWPVVALIGGAIYFDTAGREAAKHLSFRHEGIRVGTKKQQQVFFASYIVMGVMAAIVIVMSVADLLEFD